MNVIMSERSLIFLVAALVCTACTPEQAFLSSPQSINALSTVVGDAAACIDGPRPCRKITSHDGYEESKIRAMSSGELESYAAKQKKKNNL